MKEILRKKLNKKGFTLAELLIVVAIIAVLVAVAIPVFGSALKSAKEGTDLANVRACYAEEIVKAMGTTSYNADGDLKITIPLQTLKDATEYRSPVTYTAASRTIAVGNAGSFVVDSDVTIS